MISAPPKWTGMRRALETAATNFYSLTEQGPDINRMENRSPHYPTLCCKPFEREHMSKSRLGEILGQGQDKTSRTARQAIEKKMNCSSMPMQPSVICLHSIFHIG
jgi:hypothetical protein